MNLKLVAKLQPTPEQADLLLKTMRAFNEACNYIAQHAFSAQTADRVEIQKLAYREARERFGLSAQLTIRAIGEVCRAYKRDKSICPEFRDLAGIAYDHRCLSWKGLDRVSILTLEGRQVMPFVVGAYHQERWHGLRGHANLVYRDSMFFLYVTVEIKESEPFDPDGFLGVDFGLKNIAVDSDGEVFSGAHLSSLRKRHTRLRAKLQSKGTKSAKRLLKNRGKKERRFVNQLNHTIAKRVVRKAIDTHRGVALENLMGIREGITVRRSQRRAHHSWAFGQLRKFITYKCLREGVTLEIVNPRNTSRECPQCGHVDRRNRPSRDDFRCIHCGHTAPADETAAIIIGRRAEVMRPYAALI